MPKRKKRHLGPTKLFELRDQFVVVAGTTESVSVETNDDPRKIDHVWIEVRAGEDGLLQIALNTRSRQSADAGYDPRIWVGMVTSAWEKLPAAGAGPAEPFDYATIEAAQPIDFIPSDRVPLEELLVKKSHRGLLRPRLGGILRSRSSWDSSGPQPAREFCTSNRSSGQKRRFGVLFQ